MTAGAADDLPEWEEATVEYNDTSSSSTNLYIPQLSKCPVNDDQIYGWTNTQAGFATTCSINGTGTILSIDQKVQVQEWDVNCGVISNKKDSPTDVNLPTINLSTQKIYKRALTFCEYDSQGKASTKTIDVLSTDAPSGASNADGYMITGCFNP
jgi:hypothetical protein